MRAVELEGVGTKTVTPAEAHLKITCRLVADQEDGRLLARLGPGMPVEVIAEFDTWRRIRAIAWKDLTTERRSKAGFNAVVSLGITILVLFGFALGPDAQVLRDAAPGALWLAVLFAGVLAFNRSYQVELDTGALEPLLLYPGARWTIFTGKLLAPGDELTVTVDNIWPGSIYPGPERRITTIRWEP